MKREDRKSPGAIQVTENAASPATSALLHNMCCAPRTQIRHRSPYRRPNGRGVVFSFHPGSDPLGELLGNRGQAPSSGTDSPGTSYEISRLRPTAFDFPTDAESDLRRRIDEHAQTLRLPPAALVTDASEPGDESCADLLTVATVLAKSSGRVYLRDKAPNLSRIQPGRRVVLIIPAEGLAQKLLHILLPAPRPMNCFREAYLMANITCGSDCSPPRRRPESRSPSERGGGRASAALPLLNQVATSPASRRLVPARPALAPKCKSIIARTPREAEMSFAKEHGKTVAERILDCFPAGVYALHALLGLLEIVETGEVETAAVECRAEPRLLVNPKFVDRRAGTPEKLLMLVMHELHHILLGHTRLFPCVTAVDNLVFDAVINALLCRMFPAPEHTRFLTDFYDEARFPSCLLRPPKNWDPRSKAPLPVALRGLKYRPVRDVYRALYSEKGASYEDLYDALRKLVSEESAAGVPLLGDHVGAGTGGSAAGQLDERSPILFEAVRQIVERWPQPPDPIAGRSLADLLRESSIRSVRSISNREALRKLLRQVGGKRKFQGGIRARDDDRIQVDTPVPGFDRRSAVLASLGAQPLLHAHGLDARRLRPTGERVHVYLDVSGSIGDLRGALYGAILDCRDLVCPKVHLFSTEVADITLQELRRGKCQTTYGTEISCVAAHMREHKIRRAVLITDGFVGTPRGGDLQSLQRARLGVALTPGTSTREDLSEVADCWIDLIDHGNNGGN